MDKQCSVRVAPSEAWGAFNIHRCRNKAIVERNGKSYCKIHDPEYIKQKDIDREEKRLANACQKCLCDIKRWWNYCPRCGEKLK